MKTDLEDIVKRNSHVSKRIADEKLDGYIVVNSIGQILLASAFDEETARLISKLFKNFAELTRSCIRDLDPDDELISLRLREEMYEYMLIYAEEYLIIGRKDIE
ncbi:dynein light chain roadblock-type 1 [Lutzomyia longipalpis]|uniref:dynein light chain roadblock-type 1 n=1 Tax=Lutzomyia longipalpis TaxID=7200 RepID=UPI0024839FF9|nr:dynein light chain roadblock-type 1 [Lutzomyia longipalpis]